ncbi:MAG: ATP-binding protein [Salinivirgaceae bacterium]
MNKRIVIASGKGGTGKTTIATGLQYTSRKHYNRKTVLIDFDVEEPNDHLFFSLNQPDTSSVVTQPLPVIDANKCTFCGKCKEVCAFNAVSLVKSAGFAEISADLCHSCGACLVACKDHAITETPHPIGTVNSYYQNSELVLREGRLKVGVPHQTSLIRELKKHHVPDTELAIFDAPPGTSCPVVTTIEGADLVIVVAEPSPFGLNDMKLLVELLKDIGLPFGVVINKTGTGSLEMENYLQKRKIDIIDKIPFSESVAKAYSKANIQTLTDNTNLEAHLGKIWQYIIDKEL